MSAPILRSSGRRLRRRIAFAARLVTSLAALACASLPASAQDQQQKSRAGWPCNGKVDPTYVHTAEATGGKVMLLTPTEVDGAGADDAASRGHNDTVFRASGQLADGVRDFEIPIDSTIESAYFFVSLQCLQFVNVVRPSGDELRVDGPGVEHHGFEAIRLYTIKTPDPGLWKVRVAGRGFFSVIVNAKTDLRLTDVAFVAAGGLATKQPKLGTETHIEATLIGVASEIGFHFISSRASAIRAFNLRLEEDSETRRSYAGEVTLPATEFRIAITGIDAKGFAFQRIQKQLCIDTR